MSVFCKILFLGTCALLVGFVLDFFIGDPHKLPHPVRAIGAMISSLERRLRLGNGDSARERRRGALLAVAVMAASTVTPALVLAAAYIISPYLYFAVDCVMCFQLLAARQLVRESDAVRKALVSGDIELARVRVSMIVGRDTDVLDRDGICRAAVETVAENASDGVAAPLFWTTLFGAPGGFLYKSINTMDSMIGYKNERYIDFGRFAARADDAVNFIPSRLCAVLMVLSCPILGLDMHSAWRIFRRDRRKHDSPNSAETESACAGALGVRLAGDARYGGVWHKKPYIGDDVSPIVPDDIKRCGRLMYVSSALALILALALRAALLLIICL